MAIVDAILKVERFVSGLENADEFYNNERTFDAVLMNLVVIGETVSKLSEELTGRFHDIPWNKIKGLRNIIAHNYFGVDAEEVWQIIHSSLLILKEDLTNLLKAAG
ncbi:MAG: DUF86 domain-containing protein [Lewinellaceae bacterium]|nr:DUF86 domain-containing protein [Lewinellaceae bacterium]